MNDLWAIAQHILDFLVTGADINGNVTWIQNFLKGIDTSKYTDLQKKYLGNIETNINNFIASKDYSFTTILQVAAEALSTAMLPNTNSDSHMQDGVYPGYLFLASELLTGTLNAIDPTGKPATVTISDDEKTALYTQMGVEYSDLTAAIQANKGDYTDAAFAYITSIFNNSSYQAALADLAKGTPSTSDLNLISGMSLYLLNSSGMNTDLPPFTPTSQVLDDINQLVHELAYFLVPGADIAGNITRIQTLLNSFNVFGLTPLQQQFFNEAKSNLLLDMTTQNFSAASMLRVYAQFYTVIGTPDATTETHMQGYLDAVNVMLGAMMLQGKMMALDMSGNFVAITGLSSDDQSLLEQSMFTSYKNLEYDVPAHKSDYSDPDYAAIMSWLNNSDFATAMSHIHQGTETAADLANILSSSTPALLHFDTPNPPPQTQVTSAVPASAVSSPSDDPVTIQLRNLEEYLFGFLLPGMDNARNIARINALIAAIDPSKLSSDVARTYYNNAKAEIADMINGQNFSADAILHVVAELSTDEGLPNSPNTESHFHGYVDAMTMYWGSMLMLGKMYGTDINGNRVLITNLSPLNKNSLYLEIANSYQNMLNYIPAHKGDFTSDVYNLIQTGFLQNSKLSNDINILEQSAISGTDPATSVLQDIGTIVFPYLGDFNSAPPSI
ncbi:MAG: hypothetical protein JSS32_08140 [Verrucomicrobia bacterium]|nr:hypothetical protein [Verrucomicrobiota bacterium]